MAKKKTDSAPGKHVRLRLRDLKSDPRYQRALDTDRVQAIAAVWDNAKAKPPIVSRRTDGDWIMDGQHTALAAMAANGNDFCMDCVVHESLTPQREAEIFDGQHDLVRRLTKVDLYKSRVFRREPTATAIDSIVISCGLRVAAQAGSNNITAVAALEKIYVSNKNLEATLRLLRGWGTAKGGAFNGTIMRSVSAFLHRYEGAENGRLLEKLKSLTPEELLAQIAMKHETDRLSMDVCGAMVLRSLYNHRMRDGKLPRFSDETD
jgi:hypothetical protein